MNDSGEPSTVAGEQRRQPTALASQIDGTDEESVAVGCVGTAGGTATVVRGEGVLGQADRLWLYLDRLVDRCLPPGLNPFGQLGAIANTCLLIAVISGIALLIWYVPSVHQAYDSLEKMRATSWLGLWMRSLHRYSSDGCMLFVLLHAARIFTQRRFHGPRWLAWITGVALFALLGFVGWTGYWLVWDVRAQHAAQGTARFIDCLPLFTEPLERSFLTDASVHSLLFFLVFFVHMLAPLAMGVGLWVHLARVSRSRFLTGRAMTWWVTGSLALTSIVVPALSAQPARMTVQSSGFTLDAWYLWPMALTDRLAGGLLWAIFMGGGLVVLTVPWWMVRRRAAPGWKAEVALPRCMGCTLCAQDCPFNAIEMVPRDDGRRFELQSFVNPTLCVGCGICTGSCDSQAINMPALDSRAVERRIREWLQSRPPGAEPAYVAFCCRDSAGTDWAQDAGGLVADLPGYYVQRVPCVGWISAVLLERTLQWGAAGVLVVGCGEGEPTGREGMKWFNQRMAGTREPRFDPKKADPTRVHFVALDQTQPGTLQHAAAAFRSNQESGRARPAGRGRQVMAGVLLALVLCAVMVVFSDVPYRTPHRLTPQLVVSFNHGGAVLEPRRLSAEELAKRLPHMRNQVNVSRERVPVRLRVSVDGRVLHEQAYRPKGLSQDGPSVAVVRLPIEPGSHEIRVELADTADADRWPHQWSQSVIFTAGTNRVVLFDGKQGFSLH